MTHWPAEYWAGSLVLASTVYLLGILINGRWRWSPLLRLIGAAWHSATLVAFAWGAALAASGDFVMVSSGVFAVVHCWFVALNFCDLRVALRRFD